MSTMWGIHCLTCNEAQRYGFRNSPETAFECISIAPLIQKAHSYCIFGILETKMLGDENACLAFAVRHARHDLIVESEYGDIWQLTPS